MPDIIITCGECGREHKISEYAVMNHMACLTCGAELMKPEHVRSSGLRLASATGPAVPPPLAGDGVSLLSSEAMTPPVRMTAAALRGQAEERPQEAPRGLALGIAAVVALLLVGFQYQADAWSHHLALYEWIRTGVLVGSYLLVVMMAFQDGLGMGALCLVIPPYALLYAIMAVESALLRGIFYGAVAGIAAEVYFLADHSLVMALGETFGGIVTWGDSLINSAANSPLRR